MTKRHPPTPERTAKAERKNEQLIATIRQNPAQSRAELARQFDMTPQQLQDKLQTLRRAGVTLPKLRPLKYKYNRDAVWNDYVAGMPQADIARKHGIKQSLVTHVLSVKKAELGVSIDRRKRP